MDELSAQLSSVGVAEAAFIRRGKIRKKRTSGYRVVVVVGEDAEANDVDTVSVLLSPVGDAPMPDNNTVVLPLKVVKENGNKRFVFNDLDFCEDAINHSYKMTMTLLTADGGQVGESITKTVEVEDDGDSRVRTARITRLDDVNFQMKVVVVGDWDSEVASVTVKFSDYAGSAPLVDFLSLTDGTSQDGKRVFSDNTLTFEDPAFVADELYNVVIDLMGADGLSLGSSEYKIVGMGLPPTAEQVTALEEELVVIQTALTESQSRVAELDEGINQIAVILEEILMTIDEDPTALVTTIRPPVNSVLVTSWGLVLD